MRESREPQGELSALRYFGRKLREYREAAGLSQRAFAKRVNYSEALVAMVETGRRSPSREFAVLTDKVLPRVREGAFEILWPLVQNHGSREWFAEYLTLEGQANDIRFFAIQGVPGLLQTEHYARSIFQASWMHDDAEVERRVAERLGRQRILDDPHNPTVWVVIEEAALTRPVGGAEVLRDQLRHLRELVASRRIVLQVLPSNVGAHAGMGGGVILLAFDESPTVAFQEGIMSGHIVDVRKAVRECERRYNLLRAVALTPEGSLQRIESLIEEAV